jgi:hypothetical protein
LFKVRRPISYDGIESEANRGGTRRQRAALVVPWRLRHKLSLRDLPAMFLISGVVFSHEAVRDWEAKLAPALAEGLHRHRRGKVGRVGYVDDCRTATVMNMLKAARSDLIADPIFGYIYWRER